MLAGETNTSGLACRAFMRSWEKRTGVSLEEIILVCKDLGMLGLCKKYLVKTCWLVDGAGFEEPWPMSIYVVFFSSLARFAGELMIELAQYEPSGDLWKSNGAGTERVMKFRVSDQISDDQLLQKRSAYVST